MRLLWLVRWLSLGEAGGVKKLLCVITLMVWACTVAVAAPVVTVHRQNAGHADADGWVTAISSQGGYLLRLPVTFSDFDVPSPQNPAMVAHVIVAALPEGVLVTAARAPREGTQSSREFLEAVAQKAVVKEFKNFGGYSGVEYTSVAGKKITWSRVLWLSDGVLYVTFEYSKDLDKATINPVVQKILASVQVLR